MTVTKTGAWFTYYRKGMEGTLGQSLDSDSDNLGWAIRSWKYELYFNGYRGAMVLDSPDFGDAASSQTRAFQKANLLTADGVIGPDTAKKLLLRRCRTSEDSYGLLHGTCYQIVGHESAFDVGAIGYVDQLDRGPTQKHVYPDGSVNLGQAIRPALSIPRLASQMQRIEKLYDLDTAVVSWNIGEGGAEWWYTNKKPTTGSPDWWQGDQDMSERAWRYLSDVRSLPVPY